jgi:DNA-binding NtrC family response regulator
MMKSLRILVIDDEGVICDACRLVLTEKGYEVEHCLTGLDGLRAIQSGSFDVILLDMKLADMDGMEILQTLQGKGAVPCVIVMTGYATMANAVQTMKLGAADYLAKPFTDDELISTIENACLKRQQGKLI